MRDRLRLFAYGSTTSGMAADSPAEFPSDAEFMAALDRGERKPYNWPWNNTRVPPDMDERKGRAIVHSRGLPLIGALGTLGDLITRD